MMSKHTPGPWVYDGRNNIQIPDGSQLMTVGVSLQMGGDQTESRANARLIAAAPDYHLAAEWIKSKVAECSHSLPGNMADPMQILNRVEAVSIPSLMLQQLLKAHAKAEGGEP